MNRCFLLAGLVALASCAISSSDHAADDALAAAGRALHPGATQIELDASLLRLDGVAGPLAGTARFHALWGALTFELAMRRRAEGRADADLHLEDAIAAARRALMLDDGDEPSRLLLARALHARGACEDAARTAEDLTRRPEVAAATALAAHAIVARAAGDACTQAAAAADRQSWLAMARRSYRALEAHERLDAAVAIAWASTETLAGEGAVAVDVLVRTAHAYPAETAVLDSLVETAAATGALPAALAALATREDPVWLWYRGRAHCLQAAAARPVDPAAAFAALDAALDCFARSAHGNPEHADSCARWRALCLGAKGNLAFVSGDIDLAESSLLQAVCARPEELATALGGGETIKLGLLRVGDRVMRDFARAERLYRTAADAAGTDLDLLNNAAVFARDLGTRLERGGNAEAAAAMYARSHATYLRAVRLDPRSVRLRNDCALVAIHHLHRELEGARQLLEAAIADGEAQLRDDPPDDPQQLQDLDEALGDCHENLALWHLEHDDAAAALAAAERSLRHYPHDRRSGALRHLEAAAQRLRSPPPSPAACRDRPVAR